MSAPALPRPTRDHRGVTRLLGWGWLLVAPRKVPPGFHVPGVDIQGPGLCSPFLHCSRCKRRTKRKGLDGTTPTPTTSTTAVQRFGPQKPFNIPANSVFFLEKKKTQKTKNSNHDNAEQKGKEKKPRVGCFNSQAHIIRNIFFIHRKVSYIRS